MRHSSTTNPTPPTVGQLKAIYLWLVDNCPDKPAEFKGHLKILRRLLECNSSNDNSLLEHVKFSSFNKQNDRPLNISTFKQRPTHLARYLLQPASYKLLKEKRLKLTVSSSGENSSDPVIKFSLGSFQPDFISAANKTNPGLNDNLWLCEIIRKMSNYKKNDFLPNQKSLPSQALIPEITSSPATRINEQKWEVATLFIAITPKSYKTDLLNYKIALRSICNRMGGFIHTNDINEEYIFGYINPSEYYLDQCLNTAQTIQNEILSSNKERNNQPQTLMYVSKATLITSTNKYDLKHSPSDLLCKTSLYNNNKLMPGSILVSPEICRLYCDTIDITESYLPAYQIIPHSKKPSHLRSDINSDIASMQIDCHSDTIVDLKDKCETFNIIAIHGTCGIGKTHLLSNLKLLLEKTKKFDVEYIKIYDHERNTKYFAANIIFSFLSKRFANADTKTKFINEYGSILKEYNETNKKKRKIVMIDNAQWIDRNSLEVLQSVCEVLKNENLNTTIILASRYEIEKIKPCYSIPLRPPSRNELLHIAANINKEFHRNKYSTIALNKIVDSHPNLFYLIETLCPKIHHVSFIKKILCSIDNESIDDRSIIPYKEIILLAAQTGYYFKISHIISYITEIIDNNKYDNNDLIQTISECLRAMQKLSYIKHEEGELYSFTSTYIRETILKALTIDLNEMHREMSTYLFNNFRKDCYEDPILIGNHLLKIDYNKKIPDNDIVKFLYRSAWAEINKNNYNHARQYFDKAEHFIKNIDNNKTVKCSTVISINIESIFLSILSGEIPASINNQIKNTEKYLNKHKDPFFRKKLFIFEIAWLKCYFQYLQGNLITAKNQCQELKKFASYQNFPQCRKLTHSLLGKIYLKVGNIRGSIVQSKLMSGNEPSKTFKNHYIANTSDNASLALWLNGYIDEAFLLLSNYEIDNIEKHNIRNLIVTYWDRILIHTMDYDIIKIKKYLNRAKDYEKQYSIMTNRGFSKMGNYFFDLVNIVTGQKQYNINNIIQSDTIKDGSTLYKPFRKTLLAEALLKTNNFDECKKQINDAIEIASETGECFYLSETYRIDAELNTKLNFKKQAYESYQESLSRARDYSTTMLELRTLNSQYQNITSNKKQKNDIISNISIILERISCTNNSFDVKNANEILENH